MMPIEEIDKYCNGVRRASRDEVPNSVPDTLQSGSTWKRTLGSRLTVTCELGFRGSGSSPVATCAALNATHGSWSGFNYLCSRALLVCALSASHPLCSQLTCSLRAGIEEYCDAHPENATPNALRKVELHGRSRDDVAGLLCDCGYERTGFESPSHHHQLALTCTAASRSAGVWLSSERCTRMPASYARNRIASRPVTSPVVHYDLTGFGLKIEMPFGS